MQTQAPAQTSVEQYVQTTHQSIAELEQAAAPLKVAKHPASDRIHTILLNLKTNLQMLTGDHQGQVQGSHQGQGNNQQRA